MQISAPGVRVGAGFYHADAPTLARIRASIDDDRTGPELEKLLRSLERKGFERGGDRLKTSPRDYGKDHPRIDLLRHRSLTMGRSYGFEPVIHGADLLDRVRRDWRAMKPLVQWVAFRTGAAAP